MRSGQASCDGADGRRLTVADCRQPTPDVGSSDARPRSSPRCAAGCYRWMTLSRYALSADEILSWQDGIDRFGLAGLRRTKPVVLCPGSKRLTTCR